MHYTIRIFLNIILIFLLLFSLVIAYSEYSPSVNKKISVAVKEELDNTFGAETNIGTVTFKCNFGNPPYANSSDAADANGYGAFEYAPPTGYLAICTKNLGSDGG